MRRCDGRSGDGVNEYSTFEGRMLTKGMQLVQESLQTEYDEMYEHYQVALNSSCCLADAAYEHMYVPADNCTYNCKLVMCIDIDLSFGLPYLNHGMLCLSTAAVYNCLSDSLLSMSAISTYNAAAKAAKQTLHEPLTGNADVNTVTCDVHLYTQKDAAS